MVEESKGQGDTSGAQETVSGPVAKSFTEADVTKMVSEAEQRLSKKFQSIADREAGKWQSVAVTLQAQVEEERAVRAKLEAEHEALQEASESSLEPEQAVLARLKRLEKAVKKPVANVAAFSPEMAISSPMSVDGVQIVKEVLKERGIKEEEVDLALDAQDVGEGLRRFTKSLIDRYEKRTADMAKRAKDEVEATTVKVRKELGVDVVDTSGGGGSGRRPVFTREQLSEMSPEEYRRNKADIDAAYREGRIK